MRHTGFWISGDDKQTVINRYTFDDTELSESSEWKEAHQNEDVSLPHGFVRWEDALVNIERRLKGEIASSPLVGGNND